MAGRHPRGFTLIELLVALFITAIMFAFGYRALDQALKSRREVEEQSARLIAVQQTLRTLEQDFELLQPRPVRNLIGDGYLPALSAAQSSAIGSVGGLSSLSTSSTSGLGSITASGAAAPLVTFTRGGWTNPVGVQRSELQRVSYQHRERRADPAVLSGARCNRGGASGQAPADRSRQELQPALHGCRPQLADTAGRRSRPAPARPTMAPRLRPVAVEVTIELEDWGVLVRRIEVAG